MPLDDIGTPPWFESSKDEQWREVRLRRVRDYFQEHADAAPRVSNAKRARITFRKFRKAPFIIYIGPDQVTEYLVLPEKFRDKVCRRMPWRAVLNTLLTDDYLNRGSGRLLGSRTLPEPLGWMRVVSIKPKLLQYQTAYEERDARARKESDIRRVRNYLAKHYDEANLMCGFYAGRLTKRRLSRVAMLLHFNRKERELVIAKRVFIKTLCNGQPPELALKHLKSEGFLNVGHRRQLYVRRMFAAPL